RGRWRTSVATTSPSWSSPRGRVSCSNPFPRMSGAHLSTPLILGRGHRPPRRVPPRLLAARDLDHVVAGHDLDAGTALGLAEADLVRVEAVPAVQVGPGDAARGEQGRDRLLGRVLRLPPGALVVDEVADGL